MSPERALWSLVEPVHAIAYFDPAVSGSLAADGLHGFWNGYFAGRAAPLGAVGAAPVTALFFGFEPAMVARALPKVWGRVTPERAVASRLEAVDSVLGALIEDDELRGATDVLVRAAEDVATDGRALAAAWQGVQPTGTVAARLWWAATVLREHRGDGHVLAATNAGLSGLETTLTHIAAGTVTRAVMQPNRGWSDEQWDAAEAGLVERGILATDGTLTSAGAALRTNLETDTDRLAAPVLVGLADDLAGIGPVLHALGDAIQASGSMPAGNPMGLTR